MPQVFIAAVAALGATATVAAVVGTVLYYATIIAVSVSYGNAQKRRQARNAKAAYNASLQDRLVMTSLAGGQRSRVYGRTRNVEGVLFKATSGANSEFFTLVVSVAGHEVDAIETVYFDDVAVTLDGSGWVQNEPWMRNTTGSATAVGGPTSTTLPHTPIAGSVKVTQVTGTSIDDYGNAELTPIVAGNVVSYSPVSAGAISIQYQWADSTPKARVRKYLGGPSQNLSSILQPMFPALLTSADKFAGDACLLVEFTYDTNAFPTGIPTVTAVSRGAKIYDPRSGLTAWSENPALIVYDWARYAYGGNCATGTTSTADVIATANACDVATNFTTPSGTVSLPLYTCGIVCRTDQDPSQALDEIVESMAGRTAWSGGVLRMRAGVYRAPVDTINEDWLSGVEAITVVPEAPADQAVNIVRTTISDAAQAYVIAPQPDVRASAYITADGRELPVDLAFGGVTDSVHAQHIAGVILREARSGLTVTLPCNWRAFKLEVFDVVSVTLERFGWFAKLFEVAEWKFSQAGGVVLVLRETAASIFTPDALFSEMDATPNTQLPSPFDVPVPTGLTLASGTSWLLRQDDGTVTTRLHVSWTALTDRPVLEGGGIDIRYGSALDPETSWTTVSVAPGDNQANLTGVLDGGIYVVKLRARNALVTGDWCQHVSHKVVGKTAVPTSVAGLTATALAGFIRLTWTAGTEADEAGIDLGRGASWGAATGLEGQAAKSFAAGRGANSYDWAWPAPGTYTIRARRRDTSGLLSAEVTLGVTVTASGLSITNVLNRPNILPNGGFEFGLIGWTEYPPSGGPTMVVADSAWGRHIYSTTMPSGGGALQSDEFSVYAGNTYVITGDSACFAASVVDTYFDLLFFDAAHALLLDGGQNSIAASHDFSTTDANRNVHAVAAVAPVGAVYARARFVWDATTITVIACRLIKVEMGLLPASPYTQYALIAPGGVDTSEIAANAATEITSASLAGDTWNLTVGAYQERVLTTISYTNYESTAVDVELTATSSHQYNFDASGGSGNSAGFAFCYTTRSWSSLMTSGSVPANSYLTPGQFETWQFAYSTVISVPAGGTLVSTLAVGNSNNSGGGTGTIYSKDASVRLTAAIR